MVSIPIGVAKLFSVFARSTKRNNTNSTVGLREFNHSAKFLSVLNHSNTTNSFKPFNDSNTLISKPMILDCEVQSYAWGKLGKDSEVARLKKLVDKNQL